MIRITLHFPRWFFRRLWLPLYRRWALRHVGEEQVFRWKNLRLQVPPGVFHPGVFFSTPLFLRFLETIDFQNKKTLDVGTGSGVLALFAAGKNAEATALDLNPLAVETAQRNARSNGLPLRVLESDLFDALPAGRFDYFLVNPPYYSRTPSSVAERAFFAGAQLEYFEKLFGQLPAFCHPASTGWMILSEDCDLEKIQDLAFRNGFSFFNVHTARRWGECFGVWEFKPV